MNVNLFHTTSASEYAGVRVKLIKLVDIKINMFSLVAYTIGAAGYRDVQKGLGWNLKDRLLHIANQTNILMRS